MAHRVDRLFRIMGEPILPRSRVLVALLVVPLALSLTAPLWRMHFQAPQYPQGLDLYIYAHTVEGDVSEINTLNHYIGMHPLDRVSMSELDWLPFAIGALLLLCLRVAALGDLRSLVDLTVLFVYFSLFSLARFAYKLYVFGHDLDPKAPFEVQPFTPAILGTKQIAQFTTTSLPAGGSYWAALFAVGLLAALAWNARSLWRRSAAGGPAA